MSFKIVDNASGHFKTSINSIKKAEENFLQIHFLTIFKVLYYMENNNLINEWFFCIHLYWKYENQEIDNTHLVHIDNREFVKNNLTIAMYKCIGIDQEYLLIRCKKFDLKVKKEAIGRILPKPTFEWGMKVQELERPEVRGIIEDLIWHEKKQDFLYYISINGKKKSRQYHSYELQIEQQ